MTGSSVTYIQKIDCRARYLCSPLKINNKLLHSDINPNIQCGRIPISAISNIRNSCFDQNNCNSAFKNFSQLHLMAWDTLLVFVQFCTGRQSGGRNKGEIH